MKIYEKSDSELKESHRIRIAKHVAAHKEVSKEGIVGDLSSQPELSTLFLTRVVVTSQSRVKVKLKLESSWVHLEIALTGVHQPLACNFG